MRPLYEMLIASQKSKSMSGKLGRAVWAGARGYPWVTGAGVLLGLAMPQFALALGLRMGLAMRVLLPIVGGGAGLSARMLKAINTELPNNDFGMCTGLTQPGYTKPALTDWLADTIDRAAGRDAAGDPLTFGDLARHDINLQIMTTNLSMRRPYRLPFDTNIYKFRRRDFERLFPKRVVDFMCRGDADAQEYYPFPEKADLPVVVAARMSLSFPGLITAVPLYAVDYTKWENRDNPQPEVCWFSDGGISSNFPIHLFDKLLPNSPTFGISLEPWRAGESYVWLPAASSANSGGLLRIFPINGLGSFVMTLFTTATDWQDNMQSVLPGYRERIVHVKLKEGEGGLKFDMHGETIEELTERGRQAGVKLCNEFSFDDHRWRRFLIGMANLEKTLDGLDTAYDEDAFKQFLQDVENGTRKPETYYSLKHDKAWLNVAQSRVEELAKLGKAEPVFDDKKKSIPKPATEFRIVASDAGAGEDRNDSSR